MFGNSSRSRLDELHDEELVDRLLVDDSRAWRVFERRYRRPLMTTIERILVRFANTHTVDADDVYGSLVVSLLEHNKAKLRAFDATRGVRLIRWFTMLAKHATWDHLRDAKRRHILADALGTLAPLACRNDPSHLVIIRQQWKSMLILWEALNARERQFFDFFYVQGLSSEQIATSMQISPQTVYTKNYKLRAKLAPSLD
jgi:RNA polymerase sigma factor (sigma-70 family)